MNFFAIQVKSPGEWRPLHSDRPAQDPVFAFVPIWNLSINMLVEAAQHPSLEPPGIPHSKLRLVLSRLIPDNALAYGLAAPGGEVMLHDAMLAQELLNRLVAERNPGYILGQ